MIQPVGFPRLPLDFEYDTEVHESLDHEHGIFFNIYKKKNVTPKRALLIVHGQGEHGGRYQHFAHYLKDQYDIMIAPDLRGHGRSEGIRGHVDHFDEYVDDVLLAWESLKQRMPTQGAGMKRDLFGHSMGGLIALRTLLYQPDLRAENIIISSPALSLKVEVPWIKDFAARLLSKVWGSLQMETGLDARMISHDPNVVEAYVKDRLNHSKATPKFYLSFLEAMQEMQDADLRISTSSRIHFQIAGEDEIVNPDTTKKFFEKLRHEPKQLTEYPGLYHEIFNELTKEHVFADWIKWMEAGAAEQEKKNATS